MENSCGTESNTAIACNLDIRTPILCPVAIGANQTSIILESSASSSGSDSDTDTEPENERLNQLAAIDGRNGVVAPNSNISVEDSNNVVFGTAIHYNGPVTIYQTVTSNTLNNSGSLEPQETRAVDDTQNVSQQYLIEEQVLLQEKLIKSRTLKWVLLICLTLAVIGAILGTIVYFMGGTSTENLENSKPEENDDDGEEPKPPSPGPASPKMYTRDEWRAQPSTEIVKLKLPTGYAVVSHTAGGFCKDFSRCSEIVRNLQDSQMLAGQSDIWYNFLIGGDGCVYIGRGWDIVNGRKDRNIEVTIMGEYTDRDKITREMVIALRDLFKLGKELQKLDSKYKLVCHNQTAVTESPGENVCNEVSKLEHYTEGVVVI